MLSVTSPAPEAWWLWVDSNHQPRAYETFALSLELHSHVELFSSFVYLIMEAPGGVEPRCLSARRLEVRFRRPMPGTRASDGVRFVVGA